MVRIKAFLRAKFTPERGDALVALVCAWAGFAVIVGLAFKAPL